MYRIDTNQAKDEQFGIGKGEAQVIDLKPYQDRMAQQEKEDYLTRQEQSKQRQGREEDAYTQLAGLQKIDILPADQPYFAQKQADLYSYVKSNIDKIRKGDSEALIGFQQQLGDIYNRAALSKNYREYGESALAEAKKDGFGNYRNESIGNFLTKMSRKDGNYEDWDTSQLGLQKNINYSKRVTGDLSTYAQRMAQESPTQKVFNKKQAEELIYNDLYSDPSLLDQANYDFSKATKEELEKYGNPSDGIAYYQKKFAPQLIVNDKKDAYFTGIGGGNKNEPPEVKGTYTDKGNGQGRFQFEYTNTQDNPYITIADPKNPSKSLNIKPIAVNVNGKNTTLEAAVNLSPEDKKENPDAPETITLDYNLVSDIMHNKFGIKNVFDIQNKNAPSHVKVKYNEVKKETPKKDWSKYKRS